MEPTLEKIIELARKLGETIRVHERYLALRRAETNVMGDVSARKVQDDLELQLTKMHNLEAEQKPIEVADKRELARLQEVARSAPALQELLKAQADYFEMMNHVNNAILGALAPDEEEG